MNEGGVGVRDMVRGERPVRAALTGGLDMLHFPGMWGGDTYADAGGAGGELSETRPAVPVQKRGVVEPDPVVSKLFSVPGVFENMWAWGEAGGQLHVLTPPFEASE
jgi:hypothetical protein